VLTATLEGPTTATSGPQVNQNSADARSWVVQQVLSAEHLISLSAKLRNNASLLEPLTEQLFQHLLKIYRYKVEEVLQQEGIASINTARPHFKLIKTKK
jgi:hypothetical protein